MVFCEESKEKIIRKFKKSFITVAGNLRENTS